MSQNLVRAQIVDIAVGMLVIASLLSVIIYYSFTLQPNQELAVYVFDLAIVILLVIEFYYRLKASGEGSKFLVKHWYALPAMLPLVLFAYVDYQVPGVDLSLLSFITFFRLFKLYYLLRHFRRNEFAYLTAFLAITIIFSSISILFVEPSNPQASIVNIGDALWWSISTMTTVAYGDVYPVTIEGKVIAVILMFAGIGILWTFVAAVSSKLVAEKIEKKAVGRDVYQSIADAANQPIVMSPEKGGNTAAASKKNTREKSSKKKGGPNYDTLIDMVEILRNLDQKDYDALVEIITTWKRDDDKKRTMEKEKE
jgi:voltage-gated potassium channel